MAKVQNGEKILPKFSTPPLGRAHERYRRQTDAFAIAKIRKNTIAFNSKADRRRMYV